MRQELQQIEKIEGYLSHSLNSQDRLLFEAQLTYDSDLKDQLEFQRDLSRALRRSALKTEISAATVRYQRKSRRAGSAGWLMTFILFALTAVGIGQGMSAWLADGGAMATNHNDRQTTIVQSPQVVIPMLLMSMQPLAQKKLQQGKLKRSIQNWWGQASRSVERLAANVRYQDSSFAGAFSARGSFQPSV